MKYINKQEYKYIFRNSIGHIAFKYMQYCTVYAIHSDSIYIYILIYCTCYLNGGLALLWQWQRWIVVPTVNNEGANALNGLGASFYQSAGGFTRHEFLITT